MWTVAKLTFLSFWRSRVWQVLFICGTIFLVLGIFLWDLALGEQKKVLVDFCLMLVEILWLVLTLFRWSRLFVNEYKQKTFDLLWVNRPRMRDFVLGKFFGFASILLLYFMFLLIVYLFLSFGFGLTSLDVWWWSVLSFGSSYFKLLIVLALLLFFSSFVGSVVALLSTLVLYLVGHMVGFLQYYFMQQSQYSFGQWVSMVLYYILPHFDQLSLKEYIFSPLLQFFSWQSIVGLVWIHVLYIFLLLFLSIVVYSRSIKCKV